MSLIVIPARLKSKRLLGKPLIKIGYKELILRVIDDCCGSIDDKIVVKTDSKEIFDVCKKRDITNIIIDNTVIVFVSDRVAHVLYDDKIILNVQCDKQFLPYEPLNLIIDSLNSTLSAQSM